MRHLKLILANILYTLGDICDYMAGVCLDVSWKMLEWGKRLRRF